MTQRSIGIDPSPHARRSAPARMAIRALTLAAPAWLAAAPAGAQRDTMRARYERAAAIQAAQPDRWLMNQRPVPNWIDASRFWFERETRAGHDYALVEVVPRRVSPLFDVRLLAQRLRQQLPDTVVNADDLLLRELRVDGNPLVAAFSAYGKRWRFAIADGRLEAAGSADGPSLVVSPDGRRGVFFKGHDLWVQVLGTGKESALTTDGQQFYAYAKPPNATGNPTLRPHVIWSPDSKRILTVQTDDRDVREVPMIEFAPADGSVRPKAWSVRAAFPGDAHVTRFRVVAIDVESKRQVEPRYPTLPASRMNDSPVGGNRMWWSEDGRLAYFVDVERGERRVHVVEFDPGTGTTRVLFTESSPTYVDLASNVYGPTAIVPLPESNQLVWYSERSGWAHLYLYDLRDGRVVRPLTSGDWLVRDVVGVDRKRRALYVTVAGRTAGKDPYYREVARVGIDDASFTVVSRSDADHDLARQPDYGLRRQAAVRGQGPSTASALSPDVDYFVETVQRPDRPSRTVVRDRDGRELMALTTPADTAGLPGWWRWPEPVMLKAADGKTDLSAVVFRPSDFSPGRRYPVVDHIYGGPQVSYVPENFHDGPYNVAATIAEAGFVVVVLDGRGTAERSKAFHDLSYGAAETASNVEDHIAGIRQLGRRYPYVDTTRVGIYGFSGGGYMTASAMLRFPDFFKVGVSGAGNHDQRLFWHTWGERYHGLVEGDNYLRQANLTYAKNLKGKLLFIHGMMDHGVHAAGTFQLAQALVQADRDFDMLMLPRVAHELTGYGMRYTLDYFVRHLAGGTPPPNFRLRSRREVVADRRDSAAVHRPYR